jgi:4-amino-4-deoxy-L-arabinose transferase-like glycosyltransferase
MALALGTLMAATIRHPGYTDAYYYFNAGQRLVTGQGLTDAAIWTYLGDPPALPAPAHLYWMPLPSLIAALGMALGGPSFDAAQIPFVVLYGGIVVTGFIVGALLGGRRTAWLAGLLTLFSGFYMPYWTTTATFGPFGLAGSLCLLALGLARRSGHRAWYAVAGGLAGLAHLARADGLLLVGVVALVALRPTPDRSHALQRLALGLLAYLVVMAPWFARNLSATGTILPAGGLDTAWMREYDEIAAYPPGATLDSFLAWGAHSILASRGEALTLNVQRFIAEQGMVILAPLMLIGLWRRRHDALLAGFWPYGLALHLLMTIIFAFPGPRGGLFHSAAALLPFWAALGALGLDDVIDWLAQRRRWRALEARRFFGAALILWAAALSAWVFTGKAAAWDQAGASFRNLPLPQGAVVAINDPPALYYFTGLWSVPLPDAAPEALLDLAARYGVNYIVVDANRTRPMDDLWEGRNVPAYLEPVAWDGRSRVYRIRDSE